MSARIFRYLAAALLIPLIFGACSSKPAPISATASPPAATASLAPATTTPTPKPTGTPTPLGATDFDLSNGQYTKVENGTTYYWVPIQINAQDKAGGHWYESRIAGARNIALIDSYANGYDGYESLIPFRLFFIQDLKQLTAQGYLFHPDSAGFYSSGGRHYDTGMLKSCSFTSHFLLDLNRRYTGHGYYTGDDPVPPEDVPNLLKGLQAGSVVFPFNVAADTTVKGSDAPRINYAWNVRKGYDVLVVDWEAADPALDPTFTESEMMSYRIRWKVMAWYDKLVMITASSAPEKMKDFEFLSQILAGLAAVVRSEAVPSGKNGIYESFSQISLGPSSVMGKGSCTFVQSGVSVPLLPQIQPLPSNATPTPPPTPTAARAASIDLLFPGARVISTENFDRSWIAGWWLDPKQASLNDGVLQIEGKDWGGAMYETQLLQDSGVLVNFRYSPGADFQLLLDTADWNTEAYKRFSVRVQDSRVLAEVWQGREQLPEGTFTGKLVLKPDTWYSTLLRMGKNGEFVAQVWNATDPSKVLEYRQSFDPGWSDLAWTFRIGGGSGLVTLDNFRQISFESN